MQRTSPFLCRVGTGIADITPPLEVGLLMSSVEQRWEPFQGIRRPLHARTLFIETDDESVAIVSLDLLGLSDSALGGMERFKAEIRANSGDVVPHDRLLLAATHTHTSPESLGLSDIYHTPAYHEWNRYLARQIGSALREAYLRRRPARLKWATANAPGLGIHRRIKTTRGIQMSHPPPDPEIVISREGPVDESVNIVTFQEDGAHPVAILVNATCHPVHEMCMPQVSPDYPGEMCTWLESRHKDTTAIFLNGAAGNINPPTVSGGPKDAERHGQQLGAIVEKAMEHLHESADGSLVCTSSRVTLQTRALDGERAAAVLDAEIAMVRLGDVSLVFLPGEPFVETGLAIRAHSRSRLTIVVGYAGATVGYIPTDAAFKEGGYEIGPGRWSHLTPGCEPSVRSAACALLDRLSG